MSLRTTHPHSIENGGRSFDVSAMGFGVRSYRVPILRIPNMNATILASAPDVRGANLKKRGDGGGGKNV